MEVLIIKFDIIVRTGSSIVADAVQKGLCPSTLRWAPAQRAASQRLLAGGSARRGCSISMSYVYILKSLKDNKQYIGSTINLSKRMLAHNKGHVKSTKNRRQFVLWGYQICGTVQDAALLEKKYKRSHGALERAIKNGQFILNFTGAD